MKKIQLIYFSIIFLNCHSLQAETVGIDIREWTVPWEDTRPRDPYIDQEGKAWFCGQKGAYIAFLDPVTGQFKKLDMQDGERPHNLIIDENNIVWFAGNTHGYIGRLDPLTEEIEKFPMPDEKARDPHTLVFDRQGNIWFTVQQSNFIGRFIISTGEIKVIKVPTEGARPYGIWMDGNDHPWVALFGINKLATVDPETFTVKEIQLPRERSRPRRLAVTSDNHVWYVDYTDGFLGEYNPETGEIMEWRLPGAIQSRPYGMIVDDQDRLWLAETGIEPNRLVVFDTKSRAVISIKDIPSGGGSIRHMYFHSSSQSIWFGTDTNNIGRAKIN